jgi:dipeptidyl aminopeptidase/acylaminoacyl peptidase
VVVIARSDARDRLLVIDPAGEVREIAYGGTDCQGLAVSGTQVATVVHGPTRATALCVVDVDGGGVQEVHRAADLAVDPRYLSTPRHVEFPTAGGRTAHALYYPPTNPDHVAPAGETPPLVVVSHGGPTANTDSRLDLEYQYWTSRGLAVVDVDYGGSTGYGREYRNRLRGMWGVVDLDDCAAAATWLADQGLADPQRLVVRGGSAGGYTTLGLLAFRDAFAAGASYFGVGDLGALARDTHKFESRYLDLLVAPWPAQEPVYDLRSPVKHADGISVPVLLLQGTEDRVVPQAQADEMVAALQRNGIPYAYLLFEGEGHGFRDATNQRRSLEAEMSFYSQVLGFALADAVEPVEVVGLDAWRAAGR